MEKEILLPKLGESILSATVVKWFKNEGEKVLLDEPLLEVSTDKVASEIPSPVAGVLKKIVAKANEEIKVGELLGVVETEAAESGTVKSDTGTKDQTEKETNLGKAAEENSFLSPAVKRLVKEHNLSGEALKSIPCSGGRLSRSDVEAYLEKKKANKDKGTGQNQSSTSSAKKEFIPISPLRRKIAENLTKAVLVPTASIFTEIDVTELLKYIEKEKKAFLAKEKAKLTITSFVALAIGEAAKELPLINSVFLEAENKIQVNKEINLGLAIDRKEGLVVPVIKQIEQKSFSEIAKEIARLKTRALEDKLTLEDLQEGTITLTNFGMGGVMFGIPILRYPESAIIGIGAIQKKTVLENSKERILCQLPLSLTFDHRHIDGMYACSFMQKIKSCLEKSW